MKRGWIFVRVVLTMFIAASTHSAQTPSPAGRIDARARAAAERLFTLLGGDQKFEQSMEEIIKAQERMVDSQPGSEEAKKRAKESMKTMMETVTAELKG